MKELWSEIRFDSTPAKWPGPKLAGIFTESMDPTFS